MRTSLAALLILSIVQLGCGSSKKPAPEVGDEVADRPQNKREAGMDTESAWTWGYFFAPADKSTVQRLAGDRESSLTPYRVDRVVPVRGAPGVTIEPGTTLVRLETGAKLAKPPALLFQGVPQHLQYTSGAQRADLNQRSRATKLRDPKSNPEWEFVDREYEIWMTKTE